MFEANYLGLGYSGYAIINTIPVPLLPGSATENENIIKSAGSYHYDPAVAVGQLPAKNRMSLPLSFATFICPRTMPLVKALTYGWRSLGSMDTVGEVPFTLIPGGGQGYQGTGYVDELSLSGDPGNLVGLNINMTCWVWNNVPSLAPLQKGGRILAPLDPAYKPVAGWQTIPYFSVIASNAIPTRWSLSLKNNWSYVAFLAGYTQPPNPALIVAGDLDVIFEISWLAPRNAQPLNTGSLALQIGSPQIDRIFIDRLVRDPHRQFSGIGSANDPVQWEASYYCQGGLPRSN
jgi:hypothetical protein